MNENDAYIFDVEEPTTWTFTGEPVWVSGWFISKTGAVFSDIRAMIDGIPHLGVLGVPRPEIEKQYRGNVGLPHAGFLLRLNPPRGAKLLCLELRDAGHAWVEIWRTKLTVVRVDGTRGRFNTGILPDQMRRLLQARRAQPGADLSAEADALVLEAAAIPLETLPNPPFFGALEKPELTGGTQFGKVRIEGWLIHLEQRITSLVASTHPFVENEIDYGERERPEAGKLFPQHPYAARSQFFGMLDVDETASGPIVIRILAELADGTRHLVFVRRFYPRSCNVWERPLPVFSRAEFFSCARALVAASRRLGVELSLTGGAWPAFVKAYHDFQRDAPRILPVHVDADPYVAWQQANDLSPRLRQILETSAARLATDGPVISLVVDARETTAAQREALGRSLAAQIYPRWEAWVVGEKLPSSDARIHFEPCAGPKDAVRALNAAAHQATGTWITLIPGTGRLPPDALIELAERIAAQPNLQLVYTDEDRMDDSGRRTDPDFKPAWSPAFALSGLFPGLLAAIRRDRFVELGSFREGFERVAWADVLLRLADTLAADTVAHLPLIGFHRWAGEPREFPLSDKIYEQSRRALADAVQRRHWKAGSFLPESGHHRRQPYHQVRWKSDDSHRLAVTIVIPTRDRLHLLQECIELLDETVDWRYAQLVIVDDHSRDPDLRQYLERIRQRTDLRCVVVQPGQPGDPFNYSRLVNAALPHVDTPLILHLNNDVNVLEAGWLEELTGWFDNPDVGVVGAKLVYPEKTLNHTGIVIGPHGGLADTPYAHEDERTVDARWHAVAREVSAVTGACLMTRTNIYRELGGFDEKDFGVAYNDVDYCLRVRAAGHRVIYTPQAKLMHWGSATRGVTFDNAEHVAWVRRYPGYADPYFSAHWTLPATRVECRGGACTRTGRVGSLRLLLLTHNLNLEGAPLFLLEYATHMARTAGFRLEVLASQEGPLRPAFEAIGAKVTVIDTREIYASPDEEIFHSRVDDIAHHLDWDGVDLVVCNTLASFWGVHLARQARKPSLLYIHESTSIFRFFETSLRLSLHSLVGEALATATRSLFLCSATRSYYEDYNLHGNFRLVPSWIRLDEIDRFRSTHSREEMRRQHRLPVDEIIIANIGTVCERKGQHVFIRAIDHFNHHYHGATPVRFVMVGARPGIYLDLLRRDLARMDLRNVELVPETRDVFDFFVAADMFVCTSYEESFPRVVMEAMAFKTPIVSTDVHGIADMLRQRAEAYLVRPGDAEGLSRMMRTCLAKERSGKSLAPTAYSRALRLYHDARVLPAHVALAREAWLAHA
ncbi:MAG TPA: glycosyltransferase [Candidatus Didemnitutus sp.]|nr:glycosyltransferase [Candidatus Didemnitutus sp.]